jgi:hypothetical protein
MNFVLKNRCGAQIIIWCVSIFSIFLTSAIEAQVRVRGYFRKNGTYVAPHYRSSPDGVFYNNWSTKGNINPYTGKSGTRLTPQDSHSHLSTYTRHPAENDNARMSERKAYWKSKGWDVDQIRAYSSYDLDNKILEAARHLKR